MQAPSDVAASQPLSGWLFNPFHYVAGARALLAGVALILLAGWIGSASRTHFDGILDFHSGRGAPLWVFLAEGLIDWLAMAALLLVAAVILVRTRFRVVDVLGTQALARAPTLITLVVVLLPGYRRTIDALVSGQATGLAELTAGFYLALVVGLLMMVWMVLLMYRGFAVSCNVSGGKAIASFIAALILAEVLSKVAVLRLLAWGGNP